MQFESGFSPAARFVVVAGAFVLVVAGLRDAASLITPFLLAVFIAVIAAPPLFFLQRRGAPTWAALLAISAIMAMVGGAVIALVSGSMRAFTTNLPEYQQKLKAMSLQLGAWLDGLGVHIPSEALTTYLDAGKAMKMAGVLLGGLGDVLANALLILLTVIFILLEASKLPAKLRTALRTPESSMERLRSVLVTINRYMVLKTLISLVTAFLVWLWVWLLGVDFPVLWALLAFVLNFIPTIGSIIAAVPAVLLALVQLGPTTALWVTLGYVTVNTVIGNGVEPRFMGRGVGLSTLVVFVSLVFWGWVLGAVGMFLAVPLTMALKIALDSSPETRPIAIMLGPEIGETKPPATGEERAS